jgi:hypothetical protein
MLKMQPHLATRWRAWSERRTRAFGWLKSLWGRMGDLSLAGVLRVAQGDTPRDRDILRWG